MASADFTPFAIKDSRINNITDSVNYGVFQGGATNNYQPFPATSTSTSQLSFNVNVPSENTIMDRNVLIQATYQLTLTIPAGSAAAGSEIVFQYGLTDAFQAFPINSSITSMNATINNTNVSINSQDVLPQLLRMIDPRDLQKYNGLCPTYTDQSVLDYQTLTIDGNNNPLGSFNTAGLDNYLLPRGVHPLDAITVVRTKNGGGTDTSLTATNAGDSWVITLTATFTEPIFLSPFLFGGKSDFNSQGFVGLNTLNLNLNIDSTAKRVFSSAKNWANATIALTSITNARLLVNFLTSQPTDLIKAKNIIPYVDYPRYITSALANINAGASSTVSTQNIQLNQVPDYFIIVARKPVANMTFRDPNYFLPIETISVNFNNASGLLSSATTQDLWRLSRSNGSQQNWYEYSGKANRYATGADAAASNQAILTALNIASTGSVLVINPAKDLSLPAYLTNGSIGQFNFQANIVVRNTTADPLAPEICIIACNSGVFTTIAGSSSIYTGLITKQMALDVAQQGESISSSHYSRLVGGSLSDMISTGMKYLPVVKKAIDIATGGGSMSAGKVSRKLDSFVM